MHVLYSFPHQLGASGIGTTAYNQIRALVSLGVKVTVISASVKRPLHGVSSIHTTFQYKGIKIPQRIVGVDMSYKIHDYLVSRHIERHRLRYDAVHCWPLGSLRTIETANRLGLPTLLERPNTHTRHAYEVVSAECARIGYQLPRGHSHQLNVGRLKREEMEYSAATGLLVPSQAVAESFKRFGVAEHKLFLTQYGCDIAAFPQKDRREQRFSAVFLGRCEPRKGLHLALKCWADAPKPENARFRIVGRFVPGYAELLGDLLKLNNVEVIDFTPSPQAILRESSILILPSIEEGSALVSYEAMASGCVPVVSYQTGSIVRDNVDGRLFDARDTNTLTKIIEQLSNDSDELGRLTTNAVARRADCDWTNAAKTLIECYKRAAQNP